VPDLAFRLPAVTDSVPLARQEVDRLAGKVDDEQLELLRLLMSEMVSNSVRHAVGTRSVDVRVWVRDGSIRLEVEDRGPGFRPAHAAPGASGGWGLVIVDRVARRWGVRSGPETTVWLELDRYAKSA
jgi:anti-sigma regulatory factor (Ser/Thr protein kinase)